MRYAIETENLTKVFWFWKGWQQFFTSLTAVDHVSLKVPEGRIFVLLGPNGAGKTTLIKLLGGMITPSSGQGRVCGVSLKNGHALKAKIGLVSSDERSFYGRLTVVQNLEFYAALHQLPKRAIRSRIEGLLNQLDLESHASVRVQICSSGMKQRLAIGRALLHDPPLLFFDEPTKSLDFIAARKFRSYLKEELVRRRGKTLIVTTHQLVEAMEIADEMAVMVEGKIKTAGSPQEILSRFTSFEQFFISTAGQADSFDSLDLRTIRNG